jgi:mitochondrial fission protein ELM1
MQKEEMRLKNPNNSGTTQMREEVIWILKDNRVGTTSQSIGLAESLAKIGKYKIITKNIVYSASIKLPNLIRGSSLIGVNKHESDNIDLLNQAPDIIISAGRRLAPISLHLKKQGKKLNKKIVAIHITHPHLSFYKFDFVIMPKHDGFKDDKNVISTIGSINKVNLAKIKEEGKKWEKKLQKYNNPKIAVMLGGDTKSTKFSPKSFEMIGNVISKIAKNLKGSLLVTTSRRTDKKCMEAIKESIGVSNYFYDWGEENKKQNTENPYFAYMFLADYIVATGDSMSMLSEICSTGKPLYIYYNNKEIPKKHFKFCQELINLGYAKRLDVNTQEIEYYKYKPLNEAERVAKLIHNKLNKLTKIKTILV